MLTDREKEFLFSAARQSIARAVGIPLPGARPGPGLPPHLPRALRVRSGAFVTLRIAGELRGCIGYVEPACSLFETVVEAAVRAAVEDMRFPALTPGEYPALEIEISILSALVPMRRIEDLVVGTHGIVVEAGRSRGLLLPQVAAEHGWSREEFAFHAAEKAGLPGDAWTLPGTVIRLFTAEILTEQAPAAQRNA